MASLRRALPPLLRLRHILRSSSVATNQTPCPRSRLLLPMNRFSSEIDFSSQESKRRLFNRLLYRSKQRGFLELDLILGKWVEDHIRTMDATGIQALMDVLDLENPDLWKWLTGQDQPPEAVNRNPVFAALHAKVMDNLNSHAAPEVRARPGQPWVRGWDDKRGLGGPVSGNQ